MKQKQEQLQRLRETLLNLIKTYPNSPEAAKWKQMLAEIGVYSVLMPDGLHSKGLLQTVSKGFYK